MTKTINDGRQVTEDLNNQLMEWEKRRMSPEFVGEVQYHRFGMWFGHYDSRGGAMLLLDEHRIIEGLKKYNEAMGWEENDNSAFEDLMQGSKGNCEVVVIGKELPDNGDVLLGGRGKLRAGK